MQKVASVTLSLYVATLIYGVAAFVKPLILTKGSDQLFWNHLAILIIIMVPLYFLFSKIIHLPSNRSMMRHLKLVFLCVALVGLILGLFYHVVLLEPIYNLPSVVDHFFASDLAFTIWLIVPLVVMFI